MELFNNFNQLFLSVWNKGILGVDIFQIIIGIAIFSLIYSSPLANHEIVRQLLGHQIKLSTLDGASESQTSTISFPLVLIAVAIAWGIVSFAHGIYLYLRRL